MVYNQHFCAKCGSNQIRRNGHSLGHARFQCKACRYQAQFVLAAVAKVVQYEQVDLLLGECNSQRSIVRLTGVSRRAIASCIKKSSIALVLPRLRPKKEQKECWKALELDAMWTFVGRKKRKIWLWLPVERVSRRIVAWTLGNRSHASARRLWQLLPKRYRQHCWYFTDEWKAYAKILPRYQHHHCPKGEGQTNIDEAPKWLVALPLWRTGVQELLIQQMPENAYRSNRNCH